MSDTSGPTSSRPFATYDPESSSWKTYGVISLWGSIEFSETWPKRGMTRTGSAYRLPMPERRTVESGSSLLPTPRTTDMNGPGVHGTGGRDLRTTIHLLPTPNASVANDGEGPATWLARREVVRAKGINGNGMGMPLTIAVQLLPTPSAADGMGGHERRGGARGAELLLAGLVKAKERGGLTQPQSNGGNSSQDDMLPPPLFADV